MENSQNVKNISIDSLKKTFINGKIVALDCLNVKLHSGKIIGLIGPDGAGKTTLIRIMAGLLKPTEGCVNIFGKDTIKDSTQIHNLLSYMPQKFGLYEDLTVLQNLNLYSDINNVLKEERQKKYDELLKFTDLTQFTKRLAGDLSGGMKQKLGLACTLLRKPDLLLLDEPSVGVDPLSRRELWTMVSNLKEQEISILWSTSYLDEAEKCEEVIVLNEGEMLYFGSPKELTEKMGERTYQVKNITEDRRHVLRKILKDENVIDGVIQGSFIRIVLKKDATLPDIAKYNPGKEATLEQVKPRFEDAFMDLLGGGPKEESPLIKLIPKIENDNKPIIEVKGLVKKFNQFTAVNNINFSVYRGEIFGLLGPNGAGKSTTFKMLCGLLKPTEGDAIIDGLSVKDVQNLARSKLGYMAQKFSLYSSMTVLQNLNFYSGIYPIDLSIRNDVIKQMIETFNFKEYVNMKAADLPLGYKQRLSLSCAIMHHPEVLFLDEPTSGVDPLTRREFWNHINGMVEKGVGVVITTHFMDEAEYCDRIALVNRGEIIQIGSPDELKKSAATEKNPNPTLEDAFITLSTKAESKQDG